jgi:hypothetical protein
MHNELLQANKAMTAQNWPLNLKTLLQTRYSNDEQAQDGTIDVTSHQVTH